MKLPSLCLALLLTASASFAADADSAAAPAAAPAPAGNPTLRGLIASGDSVRFLLTTPGEGSGNWYSIGDAIGNWKLASWRDKDGVLVLRHADGTGADLELGLAHDHATAAPEDTKATLAQAQALLQKINFSQMMEKVMAQQKQAMATMARQALQQRGVTGDKLEAALAQQAKMMDAIFGAMDNGSMQNDIAQIYSDVYTPSELSAISDFYSTDAGQAMLQKAPEIQAKTMQIMMPKIMQAAAQMRAQAQGPGAGGGAAQP